jgi:hypothetical protein
MAHGGFLRQASKNQASDIFSQLFITLNKHAEIYHSVTALSFFFLPAAGLFVCT